MRRSISPRMTGIFSMCARCPRLPGLLLAEDVMPLLARDDELLDARLQILPPLADVVGLFDADARRGFDRLGDRVEQLAEVADHAARVGEDRLVVALAQLGDRVDDEEPAGLVAQP